MPNHTHQCKRGKGSGISYWVQDINIYGDIHVAVTDSVLELLDNPFGAVFVDIPGCDNFESTLGIIVQIRLLASEWRTNSGMDGGVIRDQTLLMRNVKKRSLGHSLIMLWSP